jgi:hypothetical protein
VHYCTAIRDECNTNVIASTSVGGSYINDTGIDGTILPNGEYICIVKEIEVFEIVDSKNRMNNKRGTKT